MIQSGTTEFDLRTLPAAQRWARLQERFKSLPEGATLLLVSDADLKPLFDQFRSTPSDEWGWDPITDGPAEWKAALLRLKPKESESVVGTYFERDHQEIDVLLGYLRRGFRKASAPATLAVLFDDFNVRLERHIRWEEEILFPEVERKAPMLVSGPGEVMRMEHREIRRLKGIAGDFLHQKAMNPAAITDAAEAIEQMTEVLVGHNRKEENVYYPMSNEMFSPDESGRLLERVRKMR
jgi:uncharacterized protein (DUF2249 family)